MRKLLYLFFLLLLPSVLYSQYNWDYGFQIGGANYLGDIGGDEKERRNGVADMKLAQTRQVAGVFLRYKPIELVAVKLSATYGRVQGADSLSTNGARVGRNLSFRSDLIEVALAAQVNFKTFHDIGMGRKRSDFSIYGFAGGGMFYNNPQAKYKGTWYNLQELGTEGQHSDKEGTPAPYSKFQVCIPTGFGLYYSYKKKHRFGWEVGWRLTFTDYIDDVGGNYASADQIGKEETAIALSNRHSEISASKLKENEAKYPGTYGPSNLQRIAEAGNYGPKAPGQKNPNTRGVHKDGPRNDNYFFSTLSYSYVIRGKSSFYRAKFNYSISKRRKKKSKAKF